MRTVAVRQTTRRPWLRAALAVGLLLAPIGLLPPPLHRPAALALLALACIWRLRRLMPPLAWLVFLVYQAIIAGLCHGGQMSPLACAALSGLIWGLGLPLWGWQERRRHEDRQATLERHARYLDSLESSTAD